MDETDSELLDYLLAAETPGIRYGALTGLLGLPAAEPRAAAARAAIMTAGPVPRILAAQGPEGHWLEDRGYYTPKYSSTHWSLLLLLELGVDGTDERFRRGVHFMLDDTAVWLGKRLAENELGWSCLWGNIVRYAVHGGFADDPRLEPLLTYAARDLANGYCRCAYNSGLACAWGVARTLWGVAAVPAARRTAALQRAMDDAVSFLTEPGRLISGNYPVPEDGKVHAIWGRLNFPLFYQADVLFALRALADAGALAAPGAQEALHWLAGRRGKNGRWRGSSPYRSRTWPLGAAEETSRWVSLQAALLLRESVGAPAPGGSGTPGDT